jgi:glutamyl-Q tRNA(Asp) synthetase
MPVTRFAPSPTGLLHLGHAYAALFAARAAGPAGRFLLRLEDIDRTRCRPDYADAIERDLAWLGLDWPRPVLRQSDRFAEYRAALDRLIAQALVYPCFCTRAEITQAMNAPHGEVAAYPGLCRGLSAGERADRIAAGAAHAWRLDVARALVETGPLSWRDLDLGVIAADPRRQGDVVLARKDVPTSYHLAVTWDDAAQGVDLVTRAADLVEATHIHRLLQALFELPVPVWHHHRLLVDAEGKRFAKRDKAPTLAALRERGVSAEAVRRMAGF